MSETPSISGGHTTDPKTPPRVITRRRGACRGCNGGTPCSACDRTGSTCYYEPKSRKASDARELDLPAPVPHRPEHSRDRPPSSAEGDDVEDSNNPQSLSLVASSPGIFSLDTNMDFLFSSGTFPFTNPTEDLAIAQPREYSISSTQYPMNQSVAITLEANGLERDRGNATDSACTVPSPWTVLERQNTQMIDHDFPEYCREDADIDYRFTTSFGLAELHTPHRDSRKHLEICRILRSLTKSQAHTINSKDSSEQDLSSSSKDMHETIIHQCVEACFKRSAELPMFLRKTDVIKRLSEVRQSSFPDVLSSLFSDAIIVIGLDALRDPADERGLPSIGVPEQLRSLDALVDFQKLPSSLLKLQTIIASILNDSRLDEILSIGVQCVRELRYGSSRIIQKILPHAEDQKFIKRAVWVLYCLETRNSIARGIPPLLHSDFIDHLPNAFDHSEKHDALVLQVTACLLLARTLSRVYMQPISVKTTTDLQSCISDLECWRGNLPNHAKQLTAGRGFEKLDGDDDAGAKLRLFCSYHECVYLLFGPWLQPLLESTTPPQASSIRSNDASLTADAGIKSATDRRLALIDTLRTCLESAYTVVSHANKIVSLDRSLAR
ncbi:hypothetical protein F5Y08DRAFT_353679 [Xylaria arbuscula]|nr:hypothetical protein F5Y08DRAFT_353679 [Xylaria arbuscula]